MADNEENMHLCIEILSGFHNSRKTYRKLFYSRHTVGVVQDQWVLRSSYVMFSDEELGTQESHRLHHSHFNILYEAVAVQL